MMIDNSIRMHKLKGRSKHNVCVIHLKYEGWDSPYKGCYTNQVNIIPNPHPYLTLLPIAKSMQGYV